MQDAGDCRRHTIGVAEHIVVPEANDSIAFGFDELSALTIRWTAMLAAVDFDHQSRLVTGEISDEASNWNLAPEALGRKVLPK